MSWSPRFRRAVRKASARLLSVAEHVFLRAHGWKRAGDDYWIPPKDYPTLRGRNQRSHRGGHAVNSQKWMNADGNRQLQEQKMAQRFVEGTRNDRWVARRGPAGFLRRLRTRNWT